MTGNLVVLLHLCDSLFPIGSFAHSDGLEAATSNGRIRTAEDLGGWMEATLNETLCKLEGPAVRRSADAVASGLFARLLELDDEVHAMRPSSTGRDASRAMGARLLKTWRQIRPTSGVADVLRLRARFTLPVAFGIVSAASGIDRQSAVEGFMYTRLAAVVSAAMRLMPLGQHEGHALLARLLEHVPVAAREIMEGRPPLQSFAPALDIAAMSQQYGHSRLFRS